MTDEKREAPVILDTVFLTGPGGLVYEIPRKEAAKHLLGPERLAELGGHLPIVPYGVAPAVGSTTAIQPKQTGGDDIEGHHMVRDWVTSAWCWHLNYVYGVSSWERMGDSTAACTITPTEPNSDSCDRDCS